MASTPAVASPRELRSSSTRENSTDLVVKACGEDVEVNLQGALTLPDLQEVLQRKLRMEAQTFAFFDVDGMALSNDAQLHDAIAKGQTPLGATLAIEWQLMKNEITGRSSRVSAIARLANETQVQLETLKQESNNVLRQVQGAKSSHSCLEERLVCLENVLQSSRLEETQNQQQALRSCLEERLVCLEEVLQSSRLQETQNQQQAQALLEGLTQVVESLKLGENQSQIQIRDLLERMKVLEGRHPEGPTSPVVLLQEPEDWDNQLTQVAERLRLDEKQTQIQVQALVHRLNALEDKVLEETTTPRPSLHGGFPMNTLSLEALNHMEALLNRIESLEEGAAETQKMISQQREGWDAELLRYQRNLQTDHKREISKLENKLLQRIQQETKERAHNFQIVIEEVLPKVEALLPSAYAQSSKIEENSVQIDNDTLLTPTTPPPSETQYSLNDGLESYTCAPPTLFSKLRTKIADMTADINATLHNTPNGSQQASPDAAQIATAVHRLTSAPPMLLSNSQSTIAAMPAAHLGMCDSLSSSQRTFVSTTPASPTVERLTVSRSASPRANVRPAATAVTSSPPGVSRTSTADAGTTAPQAAVLHSFPHGFHPIQGAVMHITPRSSPGRFAPLSRPQATAADALPATHMATVYKSSPPSYAQRSARQISPAPARQISPAPARVERLASPYPSSPGAPQPIFLDRSGAQVVPMQELVGFSAKAHTPAVQLAPLVSRLRSASLPENAADNQTASLGSSVSHIATAREPLTGSMRVAIGARGFRSPA